MSAGCVAALARAAKPALHSAPGQNSSGGDPEARAPARQGLKTIRKRSDFLAANAGRRAAMPGFVLLVRDRKDGDPLKRVGFTVTKKIGGAVVRNRMKRRFRALARELIPANGFVGSDHVIIGRNGGIGRDFELLRDELMRALKKVRQ
jgi:ribonuclease P protein component